MSPSERFVDFVRSSLGVVRRVSASEIEVSLSEVEQREFTPHVGAYVLTQSEGFLLFGHVTDIRVLDGLPGSELQTFSSGQIVATVELFTSIHRKTFEVTPGLVASPAIGDKVSAPTSEFVQAVIAGGDRVSQTSGNRVSVTVAQLPDVSHTPIRLSPEKLFGRHLAILGTTGGGKSWTLSRIIEECMQHRSKVILLDATGEYSGLTEFTTHLHFGRVDKDDDSDSTEVALPYYHLTEQDLFAIFRPRGPSQAPKLRAAIKSLKLAKVSSSVGLDGFIIKAHKPKAQFDRSLHNHLAEVESRYATFDIRYLTRQIENECVDPQRSSTEPEIWGGINPTDLANCMPLIGRINDMLQSRNLAPIFKPRKKASLLEEIHRFIRDKESRVLRVNMQYLSFAHNARSIIANAVGRHLFELAQKGAFRRSPLLVVMDEAHQFFAHESGDDEESIAFDAFGLIAKEGRKYALNLCIATQRPRDIPEDVLSQMGTLIVHRLINDGDRAIIERACGEVDHSSITLIPTLAPGEAIMAGVDFSIPLHVKIIRPQCQPNSEGANYQRYWSLTE